MNKKELLAITQAKLQENGISLPKKTTNLLIALVFEAISQALAEGMRVKIVGFGSFSPQLQTGRNRRNPFTNHEVFTPDKTVVKFKPGKALKDSVAG